MVGDAKGLLGVGLDEGDILWKGVGDVGERG